jgi:hypothetical protein
MEQDKLKEIARIFFDYGKSWGNVIVLGLFPLNKTMMKSLINCLKS